MQYAGEQGEQEPVIGLNVHEIAESIGESPTEVADALIQLSVLHN